MLRIEGSASKFCDRIPRRSFLQIGGLAMGGLSLPHLLQAEQQNSQRQAHKAVIMIFLNGGPPHQDMFDLKPEAPAEIRGEFQPIATSVPRHPDQRVNAPRRRDDGQVFDHSFFGWVRRPTRFVPVLHRSSVSRSQNRRGAGRPWARHSPDCRGLLILLCPLISICRRRWPMIPTTSKDPVFWGWHIHRFAPMAK